MKKIFISGFLFIILILVIYLFKNRPVREWSSPSPEKTSKLEKPSLPSLPLIEKEAVFVPYWASFKQKDNRLNSQDRLIYFGISIDQNGLNRQDLGLRRLNKFKKISRGKRQWLVLRMTNDKTSQKILENRKSWPKIDSQAVDFTKANNFQGLVLDLEPKGIAFEKTVTTTRDFIAHLHQRTKKENLPLAVLVYGDLFFRHRPFDLKNIAIDSEEVMVMAYDFHKSYGEPGPNFPLRGQDKFGYDMETMISDFLKFVPSNKLTVVFGMYGYDWAVDEKKRPLKKAKIKTLNEIRKEFLGSCQWENCVIKRDSLSQETEINYVESKVVDHYGYLYPHIVWFEDEKSVAAKKKFLKTKGIFSFARWAWGYY